MALAKTSSIYAICPIDDCTVAFEAERDGEYLCPTCNMEMLSSCPQCSTYITSPDQVICSKCEADLKD